MAFLQKSTQRIHANAPAPGQDAQFKDTAALVQFIAERLYLTREQVDGSVSFGSDDPQGDEARETTIHIKRDAANVPTAIRLFARGKFVDFYAPRIGEVRLLSVYSEPPDGWVLANGEDGTLPLSNQAPHEAVAYYEFRGFTS